MKTPRWSVAVIALLLLVLVWMGWEFSQLSRSYDRMNQRWRDRSEEVIQLTGENLDLRVKLVRAGIKP